MYFPIHFPMHFTKEGKRRTNSKNCSDKYIFRWRSQSSSSPWIQFEYHHSQIRPRTRTRLATPAGNVFVWTIFELFVLFPSLPVSCVSSWLGLPWLWLVLAANTTAEQAPSTQNQVRSCLVLTFHVLSYLVLFNLVLSCLVVSCLILSCLALSGLVVSCIVLVWHCLVFLSCLFLCCLVLTCLVLSFLALTCLVLSFLVLSCVVLSCLHLSCLVFSYLVLACLCFAWPSLFSIPLHSAGRGDWEDTSSCQA